jgi:ERCC4-related helicase
MQIGKLAPRAKIGIIHGRMQEKKLLKIMDDFQKEKTNLLMATTIIENGIDMPNVNTIIIEDATRLGLSQAHHNSRQGRQVSYRVFRIFSLRTKIINTIGKRKTRCFGRQPGTWIRIQNCHP